MHDNNIGGHFKAVHGVGSYRISAGYGALQFQTGVNKAHAEKEGQL